MLSNNRGSAPNTPTRVCCCYYSLSLAKSSAMLPTTFPLPSAAALPSALSPICPYSSSKLPLKHCCVASISIRRLGCLNPSVVITKKERALAANLIIARGNPTSRVSISNSAKSSREEGKEEDKEEEDIAIA
jgi:hypothetical protein